MSLLTTAITHIPAELELNWNEGGGEAWAYARFGGTVARVAEVVRDGNHWSAYWQGPTPTIYLIWIGDFGTQAAALAGVEDYASRVVISL